MLSTLLIWLLIYGISSTLGAGVIYIIQPRRSYVVAQTEVILVGLISIVTFLQIASIGLPTDYRLVFVLVSVAVLINWRLANRPLYSAVNSIRYVSRLSVTWLFGIVLLVYATYRPTNADSGMYHLPSIRWYERYQAIPGLGNLHGRLAFNSSFFVTSAAFGFTDVVGQTLVALNGFVMLLFGVYVIHSIGKKEANPNLQFMQILLLGLVLYYLIRQVSSPTPDVWGTILPLFVFLLWFDDSPTPASSRMLLLVALLFTSLTIKLATVPMLLFLPLIAYKNWKELRKMHVLSVLSLSVLLVGPWVIRNGILSGYLIYPLPALDVLPVDWKIPLPNVRQEQDIITFCARFRLFESKLDPSMLEWPTSRWVPWWLNAQEYYWLSRPLFALGLLSPFMMGVIGMIDRQQLRRSLPAYLVALAGFVFWFFKAPEFRFGYPFVWLVVVIPLAFFLGRIPVVATGHRLIGAMLGILLVYFAGQRLVLEKFPIHKYLWVPQFISFRDKEMLGNRYEPHQTRSGLVVLVPTPIPYEQSCYDVEQLCSPYFFDDLEKRGATIQTGFRRR